MEALLDAIEQILPLGPDEWEQVADTHLTFYPDCSRDSQSLRRKFQSLYNLQVPTGDPNCPPHVRKAKRLRYRIEERADSSNLGDDTAAAHLGIDDDENDEAADGVEGSTTSEVRVLFGQTVHRPLVRTPRTGVTRSGSGGGISDVTQVLMASLVARMERDDAEREDRQREQQVQQQMNMAMMMAIVSAVNPAAANILNMNQVRAEEVVQNDENGNRDEDDYSSDN
jgi:hypothetical protein